MNNKMIAYKCPRCNKKDTIDFGETVECVNCGLEFYKRSIEIIRKEDVLALSELMVFKRAFMEN